MQPPSLVFVLLLVAALILVAAGAAGLAIGLFFSDWLYSLLPPVNIDAPAAGGAATAFGAVLLLLAGVHVAAVAGLRRGIGITVTATVVLSAAMCLLAIGWGVAAAVSAAAGSAPAAAMLAAAVALGAVAVAYAWIARRLIGLRSPPGLGD